MWENCGTRLSQQGDVPVPLSAPQPESRCFPISNRTLHHTESTVTCCPFPGQWEAGATRAKPHRVVQPVSSPQNTSVLLPASLDSAPFQTEAPQWFLMFYLAMLLNAFDVFWLISSTRIWCLCPHVTSVIFQSTPKAAELNGSSAHHWAGTPSTTSLLDNQASFPKNQQHQVPEVTTGGCMSAPDPPSQEKLLFLSTASTDMGRTASLSPPEISEQFPSSFICGFQITLRSRKNCIFLLCGAKKKNYLEMSHFQEQFVWGSPRGNCKRSH